jgi:hypothetical protein
MGLAIGLYFHSAILVPLPGPVLCPLGLIDFIPNTYLAAGAGTIPSRAGYLLSVLNTLIRPHITPLGLQR